MSFGMALNRATCASAPTASVATDVKSTSTNARSARVSTAADASTALVITRAFARLASLGLAARTTSTSAWVMPVPAGCASMDWPITRVAAIRVGLDGCKCSFSVTSFFSIR